MDTKTELTGADIRAERNRQTPMVTQEELAREAGLYRETVIDLEANKAPASQQLLRELLRAVWRVAERRRESAEDRLPQD